MNLVSSEIIHTALFSRWKELDMRMADVIKDANERGLKGLTPSRMSKYKSRAKEAITDDHLHWLMTRYCIPFSWNIGRPMLDKGKLTWVIPPYNELEALLNLKRIFTPAVIEAVEVKKKKNGKV